MHDRCDRIEEGERILSGFGAHGLGQGRCREWARRNDRGAIRNSVHPLTDQLNVGMRADRCGHAGREAFPIHRQGGAGGHAMFIRLAQDQ